MLPLRGRWSQRQSWVDRFPECSFAHDPPFLPACIYFACGAVGIFNDGWIGVHLGTFHICTHFTSATSARVYSLTKLLFPLDGLSWNFPLHKPAWESSLLLLMGNVIVVVQEMAWQKKAGVWHHRRLCYQTARTMSISCFFLSYSINIFFSFWLIDFFFKILFVAFMTVQVQQQCDAMVKTPALCK